MYNITFITKSDHTVLLLAGGVKIIPGKVAVDIWNTLD